MFPGPVDQINREDLHPQTSLDAVNYDVKAFTVPDDEASVVQFVRHLFKVQVGILKEIYVKSESLLVSRFQPFIFSF